MISPFKSVTIALIACLLSGCASTPPVRPLSYVPASTLGFEHEALESGFSIGQITDRREDKELDSMFEATAIEEIERLLAENIGSGRNEGTSTEYHVSGKLYSLQWEIPDYEAMIRKAMTASLLTGGIGGIAYGTTTTPVFGRIDIEYTVTDASGLSIFSKRYKVEHEETRKKLDSDTPGAKSEIVSQAVSKSIHLFLEDLSAETP